MLTKVSTLRRHVLHSNLIEGIDALPGNPLFDSHLQAARLVAQGGLMHPLAIHQVLCDGVPQMALFAGRYRQPGSGIMTVGSRKVYRLMPRNECVPELMDWWWQRVVEFLHTEDDSKELRFVAHLIHIMFLCIHPFEDGNGRTARLILNMLLRQHLLSWQVITVWHRSMYYEYIKRMEDTVFKPHHPNVYPEGDSEPRQQ